MSCNRVVLVGLSCAAALAPAMPSAQEAKQESASSHSAENVSEIAKVGSLNVLQLWTVDQERFIKEWNQPTPPHLTRDTATVRNQPIFMMIIFGGCATDADGRCKLTGTIEFYDPDGLPYGDVIRDVPIWPSDRPAPSSSTSLYLSPSFVGLRIEDGEKLGSYRIRLTVTDHNANVIAVTEQKIMVAEATSPHSQ